MNYTRVDTLDRFMKKYGYQKINGKFILTVDNNSPKTNLNSIISSNYDPFAVNSNQIFNNYEIQEKLLNIVTNYDKIINIVNNFEYQEDNCPIDVIEVKTGLQIDFNKSEVIKTTIRLDKDIWNNFSDLCKNKYSHLNKHDIISKAFLEFIDKYN
ncbi:hypothetical protein Q5M85_08010 [Paraclostridium bifermentans]|nr:hypothetical protein [Paraclostridium bifermentans]